MSAQCTRNDESLDLVGALEVWVISASRVQRSTSASARNGKADGCPCCDVFELEDGKIKRFYCYPERPVIFAQLGVLTNREAALTR